MADYGIKVSKAGYDVYGATAQQLVFSSKYNTLKVSTTGSGNANPHDAGVAVTVEIAHGLGYVPAFLAISEVMDFPLSGIGTAGWFYMLPFTYPIGGDAGIVAWATSTKLYIRFGKDLDGDNADLSVYYKYVIYLNEGS